MKNSTRWKQKCFSAIFVINKCQFCFYLKDVIFPVLWVRLQKSKLTYENRLSRNNDLWVIQIFAQCGDRTRHVAAEAGNCSTTASNVPVNVTITYSRNKSLWLEHQLTRFSYVWPTSTILLTFQLLIIISGWLYNDQFNIS